MTGRWSYKQTFMRCEPKSSGSLLTALFSESNRHRLGCQNFDNSLAFKKTRQQTQQAFSLVLFVF